MGMLLRLWSYSHYLDCGRLPEAIQSLREAEQVFRSSAVDVTAELYTAFVFGNAYAARDAVAARQWWEAMQAKKHTVLNADYWRAESALRWIEGDLVQANSAWLRSNDLARKLPKAGAYDFDRTCCELLRRAIDATPGGKLNVAQAAAPAPVPTLAPALDQSYQWSFMRESPSSHTRAAAVSE